MTTGVPGVVADAVGVPGVPGRGEATDGESALEAVRRLHPDVVLLDVQLPGLDGIEVAERIAASPHPPPAVVLISSRSSASYGPRRAQPRPSAS